MVNNSRNLTPIDTESLIVKTNEFINAAYKLTSREAKLISILASKINKEDEDFKEYVFTVSEVCKIFEIEGTSTYTELINIFKTLMQKVFSIKINGETLIISWLSSSRYIEKQGRFLLKFSPDLKPFLLIIKNGGFTSYKLENVVKLSSFYAYRIYELLKQYQRIKERVFKVDELKGILGIEPEQYKLYANFKNRVIIPAQKELNDKTDISFEFEEIKVGRGVGKIRFIINSKDRDKVLAPLEINIESKEEAATIDNDMENQCTLNQLIDIEMIWQAIVRAKGVEISKDFIMEQIKYITEVRKETQPTNYFMEKVKVLEQQKEIKKTVEATLTWAIKENIKPGQEPGKIIDAEVKFKADEKKKKLLQSMYA